MPVVLLTRPKEDSEKLARKLAELGYDSVIEPLLTLQSAPTPPPDLKNLQAVMLTSPHALDFLDRRMCETSGLFKLPCFCVGASTASAAQSFGFESLHDSAGDGLALASHIKSMLDSARGDILHIAGRDTDSRGREALERWGYIVRAWTTYAAETSSALSSITQSRFREAKLDAVLVFSARTAATLNTLIVRHRLEACCRSVIALGLSDTVLEALRDLPWRLLDAAPTPSEVTVLQRLQELLPVSEVP
jgi:uroporphyrinogen-III synthase